MLVTPARIERATYSLEGCCSIQLSYGVNLSFFEILLSLRSSGSRKTASTAFGGFVGRVGVELGDQSRLFPLERNVVPKYTAFLHVSARKVSRKILSESSQYLG